MQRTILLVDDDTTLCELLADYLSQSNFSVAMAHSGEQALELLLNSEAFDAFDAFDAVVLDIMMPGKSGLEVLQELRRRKNTPVIMLTGRGDDIDRIVGLELGADDYLGKPCNPRELVARINAVLRRSASEVPVSQQAVPSHHNIYLDSQALTAKVNEQSLDLTGAEFRVLELLLLNIGTTLTKEHLTETVLHRPLTAYDRSIDVHISRVRQKLAKEGGLHDVIKSVRGVGYQLIRDESENQENQS